MARVHVSDAVWAEFRSAASTPLNLRLGELVTREVDRHRSCRLREGQLDDAELVEALERARDLHADLAAVVARLERRLDRAGSRPPGSADRTSFGLD
ncbi:MAG: hypothetical protein ACRDMA_05330 [Solirubrobacterales bacterium]